RELALFNLAVDSKLRSCDLVRLRVKDVAHGDQVANRAIVMQQKTQRPVQFEITEQTRESVAPWIRSANRRPEEHLFPSRLRTSPREPPDQQLAQCGPGAVICCSSLHHPKAVTPAGSSCAVAPCTDLRSQSTEGAGHP